MYSQRLKIKGKIEKVARHILPHRGEGGGAPLYPIKPGRFSFLQTKCETIGGWARLRKTAEKVPHKKVPQKYQVAKKQNHKMRGCVPVRFGGQLRRCC